MQDIGIPKRRSLRFGIPTLDDLFGIFSLSHGGSGMPVDEPETIPHQPGSTKLTLVGPEGSGKSVLALHLASRYAADAWTRARETAFGAKVIYISTDLTHAKASHTWTEFRLDYPNLREVPFYRRSILKDQAEMIRLSQDDVRLKVGLKNLEPLSSKTEGLASYLIDTAPQPDVAFIDLISHPAGDSWSLVNRLLGLLDAPGENDQHLIVIDNVDGFESLVGKLNTFGHPSSIRSRIVQLIQKAANKAHVVFVSEEHGGGARPLADISDVTVRTGLKDDLGYRFRSIEIQKARAQAIHRGLHYLMIRTGSGSTTGPQENPDDPRTVNAYVEVIPSLSTSARRVMNEPTELQEVAVRGRRAGFGLPDLDELCGAAPEENTFGIESDTCGLRFGTLTAIIGDANTHKSDLAKQFLLRGTHVFIEKLCRLFDDWQEHGAISKAPSITQMLNAISMARSESSRKRQPGIHEERDTPTDESVNQDFLALSADRQEAVLGRILSRSRPALETKEALDSFCASSSESGSPAFFLLFAQWFKEILIRSLEESLETGESGIGEALAFTSAPRWLRDSSLFLRFLKEKSLPGKELIDPTHTFWVRTRLHLINGLTTLKDYEKFLSAYMDSSDSRAKLALTIGKTFRRKAVTEKEDAARKSVAWPGEAPEVTTRQFLKQYFPGSTDYLSENRLSGTQRITLETPIKDAVLDPGLQRMLFVGIGITDIQNKYQEGVVNTTKLKNWLEDTLTICGVEHACITLGRGKLSALRDVVWRCLKKVGTQADMNWAGELIRTHSAIQSAANPQVCEVDLGNQIKDLDTHIVAVADCLPDAITPEYFAKWLLRLTSQRRPHARAIDHDVLLNEVTLLERSNQAKFPMLCAVLQALVLQLMRDGKLTANKHVDGELQLRQCVRNDLLQLRDWIEGCFAPERQEEYGGKQCLLALRRVVDRPEPGSLKKVLSDLVTAVSNSYGVIFPFDNLSQATSRRRLQLCALILEAAAREGLIDGPAVLITTLDTRLEIFRHDIDTFLKAFWRTQHTNYSADRRADIEFVVYEHLRKWLFVRRLEVHYLSTAVLSAIVERNVRMAQGAMFERRREDGSGEWERNVNLRRAASWNIRLVIEGISTLKQIYPNVARDPLFLPALRFYIGRENLTAVVTTTQSGRPDSPGEDEFERQMMNLFHQQIRTWRVSFFGELRVALCCLPPAPEHGVAKTREVSVDEREGLRINPHFELYSGLGTGQVETVALEVRLAGDTRALLSYAESLNGVLSDVFVASKDLTNQTRVIRSEDSTEWNEKLRDWGHLHRDSRLDHTMVLQVGEHWSFARSYGLRCEWPYFTRANVDDSKGVRQTGVGYFQATLAHARGADISARWMGFDWKNGYREGAREVPVWLRRNVDRVPFMWDFGFLLCDAQAWREAKGEYLSAARRRKREKVGDIWNRLSNVSAPAASRPPEERVTWREFLEAAVITSKLRTLDSTHPKGAFDLTLRGGESFVCLILEMWASEVYRKLSRRGQGPLIPTYFGRFTQRSWAGSTTRGIIGLLAEPELRGGLKRIYGKALAAGKLPALVRYSLDLFKVLLLLKEAVDLSSLVELKDTFRFASRPAASTAVCSRHWYSTACEFMDNTEDFERFQVIGLPGHFSVRGDWYLAVADGSCSSLLADRALDLLSSRRGNLERLKQGLGLPVRDEMDPNECEDPHTRLAAVDDEGRRTHIRYEALKRLGVTDSNNWSKSGFHWFWRSALGDYDAQRRAFHEGILDVVNWLNGLKNIPGAGKNGFELYDQIEDYLLATNDAKRREIFKSSFAVNSLWEFPEVCDGLIDRLKRATPRRPRLA